MKKLLSLLTFSFLLFSSIVFGQKIALKTGADVLIEEHTDLLKGKTIGIVTNHTAILKNGTHLVDELVKHKEFKVAALFGPEHGIRGNAPDGEKINDSIDVKTGIKTYSLYGKNNRPTPEMLKGIDLLIYDIQDIGARFYTYISTLYYLIQAAGENNIPLIVLDRPNPIGGIYVDGPVREDSLKTFVGIAPITIAHGMTSGELAKYFTGETLNGTKLSAEVKVINMKGWVREKLYDEYDYPWINPSPNINGFETALVYPGICLLEGTNVSEGRGTEFPFLTFGAPYINKSDFCNELKKEIDNSSLEIHPVEFTPVSIIGKSTSPKYKNVKCEGIRLKIKDKNKFIPIQTGIEILYVLNKLYPSDFKMTAGFNRLAGASYVKELLLNGKKPDEIFARWQKDKNDFLIIRQKYLLY